MTARVYRFDGFELIGETGELRRHGRRVSLQEQAVVVLAALVARPGELVTREEIQRGLWPEGSPVDVQHGLNAAVNRLRKALGDTAAAPRFIETVPRKGYRFIAELEPELALPDENTTTNDMPGEEPRFKRAWWVVLAGSAMILGLSVVPSLDPRPITSLVVLPLEELSGEPEEDYFALGMTEALITELAAIPGFRVISRTSTIRYRHRDVPLAEVARELDVEVLEGSLLRAGDRLRMTVRLVALDPERQLWTGSFERDSDEVLFLQKELARTVAREMHVALSPDVAERLTDARPIHPEAHEHVLKGWHLARKINRVNLESALAHFERATELDALYAEAHVGIAASLAVLTISGWRYPNETYAQQKAALRTALSLDATLAVAHAWQAQFERNAEWNWEKAESAYLRAIELSPGSGYPRTLYGGFLMGHARYEDALENFERAIRSDPLAVSPTCMAGWTLAMMGEYDRARERFAQAIELDPAFECTYRARAYADRKQGRPQDAVVALERAAELTERAPLIVGRLGSYYAHAGDAENARRVLAELMDLPDGRRGSAFAAARIYFALGETEAALEWLERAYENREYEMSMLAAGSQFSSIRSEPRFQAILEDMRFRHDLESGEIVVEE